MVSMTSSPSKTSLVTVSSNLAKLDITFRSNSSPSKSLKPEGNGNHPRLNDKSDLINIIIMTIYLFGDTTAGCCDLAQITEQLRLPLETINQSVQIGSYLYHPGR